MARLLVSSILFAALVNITFASFGLPSLSSDARIDEENARFVKLVLSNLFEQSKLFDAVTISESPAETDVQQPSTTTPSAPEETEPQTDSTTVEAVTSDALPSSPESTESTQPEETSSPISELETTTATTTTLEDTTETTEPSTEAVTETATETVSEAVTEIETVTITEAITDATTELNTETTSETSSESLLNSEDTTIGIVSDIQDEAGTPVRPGDGGDEDAVVLPPDSPPALSSIESLNDTFNKFFTHKRSDEHDAALKNESREGALNIFRTLGFETLTQRFEVRGSVLSRSSKPGTNLIGIMPGKHRGEPGETLMVIAGHYDTVDSCPGVDDNGAGSVAVLEAARLLSPYRGFLNSTIIFALFDLEEKGLLGSLAFTREYLIPVELLNGSNKLIGAYVADMLLTFDQTPGSQRIPYDVAAALPEVYRWSNQNEDRGDFMSVWSRRDIDSFLFDQLKANWNFTGPHKLLLMDPALSRGNPSTFDAIRFGTFMRSDHAAFWYHKRSDYPDTLNAVLLCDLGPWRGYQKDCYHSECDDARQLTPSNLAFMKTAVDAIVMATYSLTKA